MVPLIAMMVMRPKGNVSQADAHVVIQLAGNGDGEGDPQYRMRYPQRKEVAVSEEDQAGDQAPQQRCRRKNRVRQMRQREHTYREGDGRRFAVHQTKQAQQKEALQEKLLHEGPDPVTCES